jgi:hypothetical protein
MRREDEVIIAIRKFLNSADQTDSPRNQDLAEQYAELYSELNLRLDRCVEYIQKSMKMEAINYAEMDPPVLDIASRLNFSERSNWIEFCNLYNWHVPPDIRTNAIELLNEAYNEGMALKPLMDEYRKKIRKGSLEEKISLLRRIRKLDASNSNWQEDIAKLENEKLAELADAAKNAIINNDEDSLTYICAYLRAGDWTVKPDEKILTKIESVLREYRIKSLRGQADSILEEISNEYSQQDFEKLKVAMIRWGILCRNQEFAPDENDLLQVTDAANWLSSREGEITKRKEFNNLLAALNDKIEKSANESVIDNIYYKLKNFDYEIPAITEKRYKNVKEDFALSGTRKFKQKMIITGAVITVVIIGMVVFVYFHNKQAEINSWSDKIDYAIKNSEYDNAKRLVEDVKTKRPDIYKSPEVMNLEKTVDSHLKTIEDKRKIFNDIVNELKTMQQIGYTDEAAVNKIIKKAMEFAQTKSEENLIRKFESEKTGATRKRVESRDNAFFEKIKKLEELYIELQGVDPEVNTKKYKQLCSEYESGCESAKAMQGISKELYDSSIKMLQTKLKASMENLDTAININNERIRQLDAIYSSLIPLVKYKIEIRQYIEKFPTDKLTGVFRALLKIMPAYENAVKLKDFYDNMIMPDSGYEDLFSFLKDKNVDNIWINDLGKVLNYRKNFTEKSDIVKKSFDELSKVRAMRYFCLIFKNNVGEAIEFYSTKEFAFNFQKLDKKKYPAPSRFRILQRQNDTEGEDYIFEPSPSDMNLWRISKVSKDTKDITPLYDGLTLVSSIEEKGVPEHAKFIKKLYEDVFGEKFGIELFLVKKINEIKKSASMNPVIKIQIIGQIFKQLSLISFQSQEEYMKIDANINKTISELAPDFITASSEKEKTKILEKLTKEIPDFTQKVEENLVTLELLSMSVSRKISEVGIVREIEGEYVCDLRDKDAFSELWILVKNADKLYFKILADKIANEFKIDDNCKKELFEGQVIFAPKDKKQTSDLLKTIKDKASQTKATLIWPDSWPENRR